MDLHFVSLQLEEIEDQQFPFAIARSENGNRSQDEKARYAGDWLGITGSTFFPGKITIFELNLIPQNFGFRVEYKQMAFGSRRLTAYDGVGYFILGQLWIFVEERGKQEFTCFSFKTLLAFEERTDDLMVLSGVFLGRGGNLASLSEDHAAAGKACIARGGGYEAMRTMMERHGWVYLADIKKAAEATSGGAMHALVRNVVPEINENDLVIRAKLLNC